RLLGELGCTGAVIPVLNKCDLAPELGDIPLIGGAVRISAKTGEGIDQLLHAVEENLPRRVQRVKLLLPFDKAGIAAEVRKNGTVLSEEYCEDGLLLEALADELLYGR